MPWNARDGVGRLGPGIPKSDFWASAKEGIDQVGCVYTAQGFEFDYVGIIFGPGLVYRPTDGGWLGQRHESRDRRQEHLAGPPDPRPPRVLCLLHGCPDEGFLFAGRSRLSVEAYERPNGMSPTREIPMRLQRPMISSSCRRGSPCTC